MPAPNSVQHGPRSTLRDRVCCRIERRILEGRLPVGRRLPSQRALALRLGIHRHTAAAAYRRLAERGFIDLRPGSGAYVRDAIRPLWPSGPTASGMPGVTAAESTVGRPWAGYPAAGQDVENDVGKWIETIRWWHDAVLEQRLCLLCDEPALGRLLASELVCALPGVDVRVLSGPGTTSDLTDRKVTDLSALRGRIPILVQLPAASGYRLDTRLPVSPVIVHPSLGGEAVRELHALPAGRVVGVVSGSEAARAVVRHAVRNLVSQDLGFVEADPQNPAELQQVRRVADLMLTDPGSRLIPVSSRVRFAAPLRLVPPRSIAVLRACLGLTQPPCSSSSEPL